MPPYRPSSGDKAHLGDGPVGSYWRYRDVETSEVVAVKRIDPGTPMDVGAVDKYLKDLKAKPHDHVIGPIHAWCEDLEGGLYNFIAFPFQPAGSLYDLLTTMEKLDIDLVRSYMKQATEGLNHIHTELGRRHGDIKLQNILFTNKERTQVALSDFGLVLPNDVDSDLKKSIITGGTVEYLAPEVLDKQIMGKEQDMWAIGVVTFVCLRGAFPFEFMKAKEMRKRVSEQLESHTLKELEQSDNPFASAADIFTEDAMEKIRKGLPDDMEFEMAKDFVGKLMNIDYKKRITAEEALAHQFLDMENTNIMPNVPAAATPPASSTTHSRHKKSRRSGEHKGHSSRHSNPDVAVRKEGKRAHFARSAKFLKSQFSTNKFEMIGSRLRGGNGSVESDINLEVGNRYQEIVKNLSAKMKQLTERSLSFLERLATADQSSVGGSSTRHRAVEIVSPEVPQHNTAATERRRSRRSRESTSQRAPSLPSVAEEGGEAKSNAAPAPAEPGQSHGANSHHQGAGDQPPSKHTSRTPSTTEKPPEQTPAPLGSQQGGSRAGKADSRRSSQHPSPAPSLKGKKADNHAPPPEPESKAPPQQADPGKAESKHSSRDPTIIEEATKRVSTPPPSERTDIPPAASGDAPPAAAEKPPRTGSPTPSQIPLPSSKASSVISNASKRPNESDIQQSNLREATRTVSPTPSQIPLPSSKASSVISNASSRPKGGDIQQSNLRETTRTGSPTPSQIALPSSKASSVISNAPNRPKGGDIQQSDPREITRTGSPTPSQIALPPSKTSSVATAESDPQQGVFRKATFETTSDFSGNGEDRGCWTRKPKRRSGGGDSVHSGKSRHSIVSSPRSIGSVASEKKKVETPKKGSKAPSVTPAKDASPADEGRHKKEKTRTSTTKRAASRTEKAESVASKRTETSGKKHGGAVKVVEHKKGEEMDKKVHPPAGDAETTSAEQQVEAGPSNDSESDEKPNKGKQKEQPEEPELEAKHGTTSVNYDVQTEKLKDPNVKAKKRQEKMGRKVQEAIRNSNLPPNEQKSISSWTTTSDASSQHSKGSRASKGRK